MKPNTNPFLIQWLRENFLKGMDTTPGKRYFVSRTNAQFRRCINENEIFAIAQEYGFEKMENEGLDFMDQVRLYAQAEAVIGPHGAGFTNMAFAPQSATLIELIPKSRKLPFFPAIADAIGQHYLKLEGPIVQTFDKMSPDFGDFLIDKDEFTALMKTTFSA
jgi:capsular polysaccharide biosynthesis protein